MSTGRLIACTSSILFMLFAGGIAALALWYRMPAMMGLHTIITGLWAVYLLISLWLLCTPRRNASLGLFVLALACLALWWASIKPSLTRDWAPDVQNIATGEVEGSKVTLHNVRNFTWRTPDDYDVHWETRSYDLDKITGVDLFLSYWGMPAIAHTLVGFEFENGDHVVFSVEIRKEKGEQYSNIAGFFKQYELSLIAADERDIIYLRTNVKDQDVYRYPLNMTPEMRKKLFLSYLDEGKRISQTPAFYNTITANCTTIVFHMAQAIVPGLHMDPRIILSGYLPGYLHKIGGMYRDKPLDQMIAEARITDKAKAAGYSEDFSKRIRERM